MSETEKLPPCDCGKPAVKKIDNNQPVCARCLQMGKLGTRKMRQAHVAVVRHEAEDAGTGRIYKDWSSHWLNEPPVLLNDALQRLEAHLQSRVDKPAASGVEPSQ